MAHSYVQAHDDESEAFRSFVATHPDTVLLVDTYDTAEGVRRVARLAAELGDAFRVRAVRLDSEPLAELAREARAILDAAGLEQVEIVASGGLDETRIAELVAAGAPIDAFGVGTRAVSSADAPTFDAVYKLAAYDGRGRIKLSADKETLPGRKQVFRQRDAGGIARGDILARADERLDGEPLLEPVMRDGERLEAGMRTLAEAREHAARERERLPASLRGLQAPAEPYPVEGQRRAAGRGAGPARRTARDLRSVTGCASRYSREPSEDLSRRSTRASAPGRARSSSSVSRKDGEASHASAAARLRHHVVSSSERREAQRCTCRQPCCERVRRSRARTDPEGARHRAHPRQMPGGKQQHPRVVHARTLPADRASGCSRSARVLEDAHDEAQDPPAVAQHVLDVAGVRLDVLEEIEPVVDGGLVRLGHRLGLGPGDELIAAVVQQVERGAQPVDRVARADRLEVRALRRRQRPRSAPRHAIERRTLQQRRHGGATGRSPAFHRPRSPRARPRAGPARQRVAHDAARDARGLPVLDSVRTAEAVGGHGGRGADSAS